MMTGYLSYFCQTKQTYNADQEKNSTGSDLSDSWRITGYILSDTVD
ncbi:hypothetical protein [Sphingobacterium sp. LRF_L2]